MSDGNRDPIVPSWAWDRSATATGYVTTHGTGRLVINLVDVAAKIDELAGWQVTSVGGGWIDIAFGQSAYSVFDDGAIMADPERDYDCMDLEPVIAIVKEARGE